MRPRVALLTSLVDFSPGYSLNGVILDHARMLKRAGWDYDILVLKNFNQRDLQAVRAEGVSVRDVLPQTVLVDYATSEPPRSTSEKEIGFEDQVKIHLNGAGDGSIGYLEALADYDVVASHDLMFLGWHLPQNAAIRSCIERWPEKNWLSWIHSGPSQRPDGTCFPSTLRYEAAPHSTYVFLNETQRHDCALMLGATHDQISVVYNSRDLRDLHSFSTEAEAMIDAYDLTNHEIMQVYPFSTPRWEAKGVQKLAAMFGEWKKMGVRGKLVLVNAHANSPCDKESVDAIERVCAEQSLDLDKDVVLTSRYAEARLREAKKVKNNDAAVRKWREWTHCVPHQVVRELTMLANTFVFPSDSECCSLIQAEAAASGKFMILNAEFSPMREFAVDGTLAFDFRSNAPHENPEFYECAAREAWSKMMTDTTFLNMTRARTTVYNRDWIWRRQFEPILWRKFSGKTGRKPRRREEEPVVVLNPTEPKASWERESHETDRAPPEGFFEPDTITLAEIAPEALADLPPSKPLRKNRSAPLRAIDFTDPWPEMPCPAFGECSEERRDWCYEECGHCPMVDEVQTTEAK